MSTKHLSVDLAEGEGAGADMAAVVGTMLLVAAAAQVIAAAVDNTVSPVCFPSLPNAEIYR